MCGDSTKKEDVERLMDGKKADMAFFDPPYGVDYEGAKLENVKKWKKIANDELDGGALQEFLEKAFKNASKNLIENAAWYLWHAQMTQGFFAAAAAAADILIHRQIIWVKPS